jgi:hypothetical protein
MHYIQKLEGEGENNDPDSLLGDLFEFIDSK